MSYPYRVELTIGTYSWTVHRGDAPVLPVLLAPLVTGWQFPDSDLWPVQPEPVASSLSILAYAAADLAGINIGTTYHLRVYAGAVNSAGVETPTVRTAGRVSQLDGSAFRFRDPVTGLMRDGWKLDLHLVDYTADPAEVTVYATNVPLQNLAGDVLPDQLLMLTAGVPDAYSPTTSPTDPPQGTALDRGDYLAGGAGAFDTSGVLVEAPDTTAPNKIYGPATLAETFDKYLSLWPNCGSLLAGAPASDRPESYGLYSTQGWRRAVYRAKLTAAGLLDAVSPWRLEWVSRRNLSTATRSTLPLKFAAHAGVYGPVKGTPNPALAKDSNLMVSAAVVDVDANWSRTKQTEPNRVVLANGVKDPAQVSWATVTRSDARAGDAVITTRLDDVPLRDSYMAGWLADMYNGDDEQTSATQWALGTVTWYASRDASWPRNVSLFPDAELWLGHSTPFVIEGIPASQVPVAGPYVGGAPKAVQFTIAGGEFQFDLSLYPRIPRPAGGALTWSNLAAAYAAVKWNQLDTASWTTYRLAHTTTID